MIIYSLSDYLKDTFGGKVYKIAIDGGFTCPTRDGSKGMKGCIFCSETGSGDFAASRCKSITEQLEEGKKRVEAKISKVPLSERKYIAYFQNYTNTYGPVDKLRQMYLEAISPQEVVCLSIATRPDCLSDDVIELLEELNAIKPVWIELGLQTIHESTARYIRRGYELKVYEDAVRRLSGKVSHIITHMIIGLPQETEEMIVQTAEYIGKSGVDGIKLQLLHVIKGTDLAEDFFAGKFETLTQKEYTDILIKCLRVLPEKMVIHRLTGDGDKRTLVAPLWSGDKKKVLNGINTAISHAER